MPTSIADALSYRQAYAWSQRHPLRLSEVPVEHAVSLPLPTLTRAVPAYMQFASPARRTPGQPTVQEGPDRWWLFSPNGGRLLLYALSSVAPVAPGVAFEACETSAQVAGVDELREAVKHFLQAMDAAVPQFFAGTPSGDMTGIADMFDMIVPAILVPQYRAYAPDFLDWIGR